MVGGEDLEVLVEMEVTEGMGTEGGTVTVLTVEEVGMVALVGKEEMGVAVVMEGLEDRVEKAAMLGREDLVLLKQRIQSCLCWLKLTACMEI